MYADEYTPLREYASQLVDFSETEWRAHRDLLTRRFLRKGEYLAREGNVCNYVSFINSGSLRVFMQVRDHEISKHFFFEHEYASDYASFLTRSPGLLNMKALEDTELMELSYENVQRLYERFPVWQKYGRLIAEHLYISGCQPNTGIVTEDSRRNVYSIIRGAVTDHCTNTTTLYRFVPRGSTRVVKQNSETNYGAGVGLLLF